MGLSGEARKKKLHTEASKFQAMKSFEGPVLKCRGSRKRRASNINELVIHEIRNNVSAIFQKILFICCKIKFVQRGKNP
jgi:hypothetical protein